MNMGDLVEESALRARLYRMEANLGRDAARATPQYQELNKRLSDLEAKNVSVMIGLMGL